MAGGNFVVDSGSNCGVQFEYGKYQETTSQEQDPCKRVRSELSSMLKEESEGGNEVNCPQCGSQMQSERSMETRHYRCDDCDAEFVKGDGKGLQKIDGGTVELGRADLALCTDALEEE